MLEVDSLSNQEGLSGKLICFINKLAKSPLLLAFLLNLVAFLFRIIAFELKYEVSDDYFIDAVLSGAYGKGYDPNLLFGNVILGYILVFLYKLIPTISFYFVTLVLLGFVSVTVILYLLFKKNINVITVSIAIIFLSFVTDDLYVLIQFTKASTAAGIAGGLLVIHALFEVDKKRVRYLLLGFLLMLVASMVRFSTIYIYAGFLVIVFLYYCISYFLSNKHSEKEKSSYIKLSHVLVRFIICVFVIGSIFGFNYLGQLISRSDKDYEEYYKYSSLRSSITDVTIPEYEDIEDDYAALGLNYTDYAMLNSWLFDDKDIYSDELLQEVADINKNAIEEKSISVYDALSTLVERCVFIYPVAIALYVIVIFALFTSKKKISPIILLLASFAFLAFFVYFGRTVYRVEWSIYCCAVYCMVAGYSFDTKGRLFKLKTRLFGKDRQVLFVLTTLVVGGLLITRLPRLLTRPIYLNVSDEAYSNAFYNTMYFSGDYIPEKIGFPTVSRKPTPNLIAYLESDTSYYYVDFGTGIQNLYYNYEPWLRPEQGLFCNEYSYFGSCMMRNPGEIYALEYNGCDPYNPFKSLTNDNILLVDNWGYDYKLEYVRHYYCQDAECELVDVIDGYYIWNIYDSNSIEETYD